MKKLLLLSALFILGFGFTSFAQSTSAVAAFKWEKTEYNFGNIPQNVPATATFKFTNTGKVPLVISSAQGSCGCTVPEWPKEPIAPGKTGEIKATYNAANPGQFTKTVSITANVDGGVIVLTLKGNVESKAANK